ncbi:MAG: NDP-sugar synthase [Nitrospiria bacterium]
MKAMILAAGFGKRLRPLTDSIPKPLLPVGGRPMIVYNLLLLKKYGITDVIINLHHFGDQIKSALGDGTRFGMALTYSEEAEPLETGGGIKKAAAFFGQSTFIVINGDILIDIDLGKLLSFHDGQKAAATLVLREAENPAFETVEVDECGQICNFRGRFDLKNQKTRKLMFTGLHVMEPSVLDCIPPGVPYSIIDAYLEMIRSGEKLSAFVTGGYWNDLGDPERYAQTRRAFESGGIRLSYLESNLSRGAE